MFPPFFSPLWLRFPVCTIRHSTSLFFFFFAHHRSVVASKLSVAITLTKLHDLINHIFKCCMQLAEAIISEDVNNGLSVLLTSYLASPLDVSV